MNSDKRREFIMIRYSDLTAICEHFEKREAEGWRLVSLRLLAEYRRCEPQKVRYSAELLETARIIGNEIPEKSRDYIDMCEQAGWSFVSNNGPLHIFRTETEDAPEIVSDPVEKLRSVKKATIRIGFILCILIAYLCVQAIFMTLLAESPAIMATRYPNAMFVTGSIFAIGYSLIYVLEFLFWYSGAKRAVAEGLPIPFNDLRAMKRATTRERIFVLTVVAFPVFLSIPDAIRGEPAFLRTMILTTALIAGIFIANYFINKRNLSPSKILIRAMIVSVSLVLLFGIIQLVIILKDSSPNEDPSVGITTDAWGKFVPSRYCIPVTISNIDPDFAPDRDPYAFSNLPFIFNRVRGESTILAGLYEYRSAVDDVTYEGTFGYLTYRIYYSSHEGLIRSYARTLDKYGDKNGIDPKGLDATLWAAKEAYFGCVESWGREGCVVIYDRYVLVIDSINSASDKGDIEKIAEVFADLLGNG